MLFASISKHTVDSKVFHGTYIIVEFLCFGSISMSKYLTEYYIECYVYILIAAHFLTWHVRLHRQKSTTLWYFHRLNQRKNLKGDVQVSVLSGILGCLKIGVSVKQQHFYEVK